MRNQGIIIDIETVARTLTDEQRNRLRGSIQASANIKDPAKIAADIESRWEKRLATLALDPLHCEIVSVAYRNTYPDGEIWWTCRTEIEIVETLHEHLNKFALPWIGFNIRSFDLPVLMAAFMRHGIRCPLNLYPPRSKWDQGWCFDLMDILPSKTGFEAKESYLEAFGIEVDNLGTGADVAGWYAEGNWEAIRAHNIADVEAEWQLYRRVIDLHPPG